MEKIESLEMEKIRIMVKEINKRLQELSNYLNKSEMVFEPKFRTSSYFNSKTEFKEYIKLWLELELIERIWKVIYGTSRYV